MSDVHLSLQEAAELADIRPSLLKLWMETGKFKTSSFRRLMTGETIYHFSEADIARLVEFTTKQGIKKPVKTTDKFVDDGKQEKFTVREIASMWGLSSDTIQRMFQDEPGVMTLGNKNPRGKRRRVTLRIPRAVMERVDKNRSNR